MNLSAFSAKSPYEIGDKVNVLVPAKEEKNTHMFVTELKTITDIACIHYLRDAKTLFLYELDNSLQYKPLVTGQELGQV